MHTEFTPFLLVSDKDDPANGHAYYFLTTYDKVVVLPGNALSGGSNKIRRDYPGGSGAWGVTKETAEIGDRPWFCYWNSTSVEGFLYVDKPMFSSMAPSSASATPTPSPESESSLASAADAAFTGSYSKPHRAGNPFTTIQPTQTISTTISMPSTTGTYEGQASDLPEWLHENYPEYSPKDQPWLQYHDENDDGDNDEFGGVPTQRHRKRQSLTTDQEEEIEEGEEELEAEDYGWLSGQSIPVFPYLVKIEERRTNGAPQPYCQQYQLLNDGTWNWIPDPNDDSRPITIQLEEDVPSYQSWSSEQWKRKRAPDGACHCQWMSGLGAGG